MKSILILPAYNEQGKIGITAQKARKYVSKVLVVDDCSTDDTRNESLGSDATVISHKQNMGVGGGIKTGMRYAIDNNYETILIMAGDAQDDPVEIPKFLKKIEDGYEFIQGSRYIHEDSRDYPKFRLITTKMYTKFISIYTWKKVTDASNGFRAMTNNFISKLNLNSDSMNRYEFETYLLLTALRKAKYAEVPVKKYYFASKGYSKMDPFISWIQMFKPIFKDFLIYRRGKMS